MTDIIVKLKRPQKPLKTGAQIPDIKAAFFRVKIRGISQKRQFYLTSFFDGLSRAGF
ncbi:MAG: hypothetical protein LBP95_03310 [Deltaproteobacteria bacterium]|nr:hypothetical protein [Deltaproteobacteria bacterium]